MPTSRQWLLGLVTLWLLASGGMVAVVLDDLMSDTRVTHTVTHGVRTTTDGTRETWTSTVGIAGPGGTTVPLDLPAAAASSAQPKGTAAPTATATATAIAAGADGKTTTASTTDDGGAPKDTEGEKAGAGADDAGTPPTASDDGHGDWLATLLAFVLLGGLGVGLLAFRTLRPDAAPDPPAAADELHEALTLARRAEESAREARAALVGEKSETARLLASAVAVDAQRVGTLVARIAERLAVGTTGVTKRSELERLGNVSLNRGIELARALKADDGTAETSTAIDRLTETTATAAVTAARQATYAVMGVREPSSGASEGEKPGAEPARPSDAIVAQAAYQLGALATTLKELQQELQQPERPTAAGDDEPGGSDA